MNQNKSTSRQLTGNINYLGYKTEDCNCKDAKNSMDDLYSNTEEYVPKSNSNFFKFSQENNDEDASEKAKKTKFSECVNISTCGDQIMKTLNNEEDFADKDKFSKNYINFNSNQNMRKSGDHYYENESEIAHFRNKVTPPKYNENYYNEEDYQMYEENENMEPLRINEIKNIKIQKKIK